MIGAVFVIAAVMKWTYVAPLERDVAAFLGLKLSEAGVVVRLLPRLLIGAELGVGIALLQPYGRKRIVLPICAILLLGFAVYLLMLDPAKENCGCFGVWLKMGPRASLVKTVVLLVITVVNWFTSASTKRLWIPVLLIVLPMLVMPLLLPVEPVEAQKPGRFDELAGSFNNAEGKELLSGLRVVTLFSANCEHCMAVAESLAGFQMEGVEVFMIIQGNEKDVEQFRRRNDVDFFPWLRMGEERIGDFYTKYLGDAQSPPRVYLLKNGQEVAHWDESLDLNVLRKAIKENR